MPLSFSPRRCPEASADTNVEDSAQAAVRAVRVSRELQGGEGERKADGDEGEEAHERDELLSDDALQHDDEDAQGLVHAHCKTGWEVVGWGREVVEWDGKWWGGLGWDGKGWGRKEGLWTWRDGVRWDGWVWDVISPRKDEREATRRIWDGGGTELGRGWDTHWTE